MIMLNLLCCHQHTPFNFISLLQDLGSQTLRIFSVLPLTRTVPDEFMAKLYIESLFPVKDEAGGKMQEKVKVVYQVCS